MQKDGRVHNLKCSHLDTTNDEDKIKGYKVLICRVEVERV
jgi:hypothetical protein